MEFSSGINRIAKSGLILSVVIFCLIGIVPIFYFYSFPNPNTWITQVCLVVMGVGLIVSVFAWGILGVISEVGVETHKTRVLLEEIEEKLEKLEKKISK